MVVVVVLPNNGTDVLMVMVDLVTSPLVSTQRLLVVPIKKWFHCVTNGICHDVGSWAAHYRLGSFIGVNGMIMVWNTRTSMIMYKTDGICSHIYFTSLFYVNISLTWLWKEKWFLSHITILKSRCESIRWDGTKNSNIHPFWKAVILCYQVLRITIHDSCDGSGIIFNNVIENTQVGIMVVRRWYIRRRLQVGTYIQCFGQY